MALLVLAWAMPGMVSGEEASGFHPLHHTLPAALASLPAGSHLLLQREPIEQFLAALEASPPNWAQVYGRGITTRATMTGCLLSTVNGMPCAKARRHWDG
jgi:hypothetical protein